MAAAQCDNFIGNAWKKDLCLNCFKSKEEHLLRNGFSQPIIQTRIPDPPKEGILKGTKSKNSALKGNKVIFLNKEYEVIGFGGDDSYSDDDYPDSPFNQLEDDDDEDSEEDKAFQKLTKTNTDYNSISKNLQEPKEGEVKKVIEPLKLGKQVFDDKGNKKTLFVSVTPFGDQTAVKNKINVNGIKAHVAKEIRTNGHGSNSETLGKSESEKNSTPIEKVKPFVEKTETIINGSVVHQTPNEMNGDVVKNEKSENSLGIVKLNNGDASNKVTNEKSLKRSQPLDKNFKFRLIKDFHRENEKPSELCEKEENLTKSDKIKTSDKVSTLIDKAKKKVNQFPVITDNSNFKFKTKDFTNSCTKKTVENNKAVVLDIYNIQEKEDVKTNNEVNEEKTIKEVLTSSEKNNKIAGKEIRSEILETLAPENRNSNDSTTSLLTTDVEDKRDKVESGLNIDRSKLIPNVSSLYRHHLKKASPQKDEADIEARIPIVKPLMNGVVSSMTLVPSIECKFQENEETSCNVEHQLRKVSSEVSNVLKVEEISQKANKNLEDSEEELPKEIKFKKISFGSVDEFDKIIKDEEVILFSVDKGIDFTNCSREEENSSEGFGSVSKKERNGQLYSGDSPAPPALPTRPPPPLLESRTPFLQDFPNDEDAVKMTLEKPKVPTKPILVQSKRTNFQSPVHTARAKSPSMEKFLDATASPQTKSHVPLQESLSSDSSKNQKRPAPKPPSPKEDLSHRYETIFTELETSETELKQPEVAETSPKRISRSTENLLEFITDQEEKNQLSTDGLEVISTPEPVPRRSLSLSQDNLSPSEAGDVQSKKKLSKGRFLLQKLLHIRKPKDTCKEFSPRQKISIPSTLKQKLEIIHPSDLNGSRVEVVPPVRTFKGRRTSSSASSSSGEQRESDVFSDSSASHSVSSYGNDSLCTNDRPKKPPPPPRAHSLDTWNAKPARPPPPKSIDVLRQVNSSWCSSVEAKSDNLYANLGEARSGLAPNKPVRTGSLRETNMDNLRRVVAVPTQPEDSDYESFVVSSGTLPIEDNLYECVQTSNHRSSLPECDSLTDCSNPTYIKGKRSTTSRDISHRRSEGNVDLNSDCLKMKFLRSVSLPYCASETESEIYSPYSFYGSELGEEDYEITSSNHILRMSRLKLKKGRSIVHKNLEDNYGAVVVANHEALAQVVEQMRQGPGIPPALRALSSAVNLRWTDFIIAKDTTGVAVERRVFYPALWGTHNVTVSLMAEQGLNSSLHAKGPFSLNPITELNDLVPASYLPMLKKDDSEPIQASISVLTRLQIETIETYGKSMGSGIHSEESKKEVNFVVLQMINAFKSLQAQGIEEVSKNLTSFVVCREEKDPHPRVCIVDSFEGSGNRNSLCQCLIHAITEILPPTDLTSLISNVLQKEKAVSLSQAKGILEFILWGPADIAFGISNGERESALQRWLDLERATVLHGLVRTRTDLTVFEEWQLLFLVRTSAKIMAEASLLLEYGMGEDVSTA